MSDATRKEFDRDEYRKGLEGVAKEEEVRRLAEHAMLLSEATAVVGEAMSQAEAIAADGNPHKRRVADFIQAGIADAFERTLSGRHQVEEVRGAKGATPFPLSEKNSESSKLISQDSSPQALTQTPAVPAKLKRGPGRPRKEKKT